MGNLIQARLLNKNRIAIFDTNAYRVLSYDLSLTETKDKTARIIECERNEHVLSLANPYVIWELLAHLADENDSAYEQCLNALVALSEHSSSDEDNGALRLFADTGSTICLELFGQHLPSLEQTSLQLSQIALYVKNHAPVLPDPTIQNNIHVFSKEMDTIEKNWVCEMEKSMIEISKATNDGKQHLFNNNTIENLAATLIINDCASALNISLDNNQLKEKISLLKKTFPVSIKLLIKLIEKFKAQNFVISNPKKKRWNFIWDFKLSFAIGDYHNIDGIDIFFITGDKEIKAAADEAGCGNRVLSLDEYLVSINYQT